MLIKVNNDDRSFPVNAKTLNAVSIIWNPERHGIPVKEMSFSEWQVECMERWFEGVVSEHIL